MEGERLNYLIHQYASKRASGEEVEELFAWLRTAENHDLLLASLEKMATEKEPAKDYRPEYWEPVIHMVLHERKTATGKLVIFRNWKWIAAASIVLVLAAAAYFWLAAGESKDRSVVVVNETEILPAKTGAILTLADGSEVLLDTVRNGTIALQGGVAAKVTDGVLSYEGKGGQVLYNTMSTPKGRQYRIALPDGSEVWLNASSSIRFPTVFKGGERIVEVKGEVYFEVARDKTKPFRVQVNGSLDVEVLGTHFNINAYDNEQTINTTLLEGSIKVNGAAINPGQQAQVGATNRDKVFVNDADIAKVMAWKNGLFDFDNVKLEDAIRQLERWYDVEVIYENGIPDIELMGKLSRGVNLNDLMGVLESLGVNAQLTGRKLIIFKEKRY